MWEMFHHHIHHSKFIYIYIYCNSVAIIIPSLSSSHCMSCKTTMSSKTSAGGNIYHAEKRWRCWENTDRSISKSNSATKTCQWWWICWRFALCWVGQPLPVLVTTTIITWALTCFLTSYLWNLHSQESNYWLLLGRWTIQAPVLVKQHFKQMLNRNIVFEPLW